MALISNDKWGDKKEKPGKNTRLWGFLRLFCTLKRAIDAHEETG